MKLFGTIRSLADLKKEYRSLAIENHPDKGGDVEKMKIINVEFEKLFEIWKHDKTDLKSGYEGDYADATSKEYERYVYNEYNWTGSNYKGERLWEVIPIIRDWLKDTYPRCKFSVTNKNNTSICIRLMSADFEAFKKESEEQDDYQINHYRIFDDKMLTDRAKEVMSNVSNFANSYNYDDSDSMTDYFCKNFYLYLTIGRYDKPFKVVIPKLKANSTDIEPEFKHKEGEAHKKIRQALGKHSFGEYEMKFRIMREGERKKYFVLGELVLSNNKESRFNPLTYAGLGTARKRMDKLREAGIISHMVRCYVVLDGYTEEVQAKLEEERNEFITAKKEFDAKLCREREKKLQVSKDK